MSSGCRYQKILSCSVGCDGDVEGSNIYCHNRGGVQPRLAKGADGLLDPTAESGNQGVHLAGGFHSEDVFSASCFMPASS
jgi:hypothetical protein